jgi:hypothetical protein
MVVVGWQLVCVATCSLDPKNERKQLVSWYKTKIEPQKTYLWPKQ